MEPETKILDRTKKQRITEMLGHYGIERLDYLVIRTSRKTRMFSGIISKEEIISWLKSISIDNMGLYLASVDEPEIRLSIDAAHLLSGQISRNIVEISDEQAEKWFHGEEIEVNEKQNGAEDGFVIIKNQGDIIGVGKMTKTRVLNYLPKERRIKGR
ncbi:MAG: tRNA pseudouridine(55) synthase TruB [archaeon]